MDGLFSEIFSPSCVSCGEYADDGIFCSECREKLRPLKMFCRTCGHPLNVDASACAFCAGRKFDVMFSDYLYAAPLKDLLKSVKFSYGIRGIKHLGGLIRTDFTKLNGYDMITPVPSHYIRRFRRFIHPADILAHKISEVSGVKTEKVLYRKKKTGYQWKLKKKQRIRNVKGAFVLKGDCKDMRILIVDDIYTTGSTVNECAELLKKNGAERVDVYALSCAGYY